MNVVEYITPSKKIAFCIVDDIETYANDWIKETIKNVADFTVSNLYTKGYSVFVGLDEDLLLKHVTDLGYGHAVVMSPGTEYIHGTEFFESLDSVIQDDFLVMGHILDRGRAYYELHHQCYIINLAQYHKLGQPIVGKEEMGAMHTQIKPFRSVEDIHGNYTPIWIAQGDTAITYDHKRHGWNLISIGLKNNKNILVFGESLRHNKRHYYPESKKDFMEKVSQLYQRQHYCATEFIHTKNNEWDNGITRKFNQVIIPASGTLYLDLVDCGTVIFYDYNQQALDYWREHHPKKEGILYKFVKTDLLNDDELLKHIDMNAESTLINVSNIFCYEATATVYSLAYRLHREKQLVNALDKLNDLVISFTMSACCGFSDKNTADIKELIKPTWHVNQDWNE